MQVSIPKVRVWRWHRAESGWQKTEENLRNLDILLIKKISSPTQNILEKPPRPSKPRTETDQQLTRTTNWVLKLQIRKNPDEFPSALEEFDVKDLRERKKD